MVMRMLVMSVLIQNANTISKFIFQDEEDEEP